MLCAHCLYVDSERCNHRAKFSRTQTSLVKDAGTVRVYRGLILPTVFEPKSENADPRIHIMLRLTWNSRVSRWKSQSLVSNEGKDWRFKKRLGSSPLTYPLTSIEQTGRCSSCWKILCLARVNLVSNESTQWFYRVSQAYTASSLRLIFNSSLSHRFTCHYRWSSEFFCLRTSCR